MLQSILIFYNAFRQLINRDIIWFVIHYGWNHRGLNDTIWYDVYGFCPFCMMASGVQLGAILTQFRKIWHCNSTAETGTDYKSTFVLPNDTLNLTLIFVSFFRKLTALWWLCAVNAVNENIMSEHQI